MPFAPLEAKIVPRVIAVTLPRSSALPLFEGGGEIDVRGKNRSRLLVGDRRSVLNEEIGERS
jgi:hypothetical protein